MRPFGDLAIAEPIKNREVAEGQPRCQKASSRQAAGRVGGLFRSRHGPTSVVADVPPKTAAAEDETAQRGQAHG